MKHVCIALFVLISEATYCTPCHKDSFFITFTNDSSTICPGDKIYFNANVKGGLGRLSYNWSTGDTTEFTKAILTKSGWTSLEVKATGCPNAIKDSAFTIVPNMQVDFKLPNPENITVGKPVVLEDHSTGGDYSFTYAYDNSNADYFLVREARKPLGSPTEFICINTTPHVLTAGIAKGKCRLADTFKFTPKDSMILYFHNAIVPSSHNYANTQFGPAGLGVVEFHMQIFDRSGQCIFECNEPGCKWDGTLKNGRVIRGVYQYVVEARGSNGIAQQYFGTVTVML